MATRGSRMPPAWVSWQVARRLGAQRGVLLLVLAAVALAALALIQPVTAERAFRDHADLAVGAALRVTPGVELADDPGLAAQYAQVAGGEGRVVPARTDRVELGAAGSVPLLSLDAQRAGRVTTVRADLLPGTTWPALAARLAAHRAPVGVPLPGQTREVTVELALRGAEASGGARAVLVVADEAGTWAHLPLGVVGDDSTRSTVSVPGPLRAAHPLRLVGVAATLNDGGLPTAAVPRLEVRSVRAGGAWVDTSSLTARVGGGELTALAPGPPVTVPVVLDAAVAERAQLQPGGFVEVDLQGRRVSLEVVGVAQTLPAGAGAVVDLPTTQLAVAELAETRQPVQVPPLLTPMEWWLDPADAAAARGRLDRAPRLAVGRVDRDAVAAARLRHPVNAAVRGAFRLTGAAALLLAVVAFAAATVAVRRIRRHEEAVLVALGQRPAAARSAAGQERVGVATLAALAGVGVGVVVAVLVVPGFCTVDGVPAVPRVRLELPWGALLGGLALTVLLLGGASLAVTGGSRDPASVLREGER